MSESLIIFSHEWVVTAALASLLAPPSPLPVTAVYDLTQLISLLREQPHTPVVLGLRPHEHVADLYRIKSLLASRVVMFVGRCFYWTDYTLPKWLGLRQYEFCTWDTMQDPFSRRMELRRFRQLSADRGVNNGGSPGITVQVNSVMAGSQVLDKANRWLYRKLSEAGLTGFEVWVLSLVTEGGKGNLPGRVRSLHKNNGLYKLGMTKHVINLHRGVKVRPELQIRLPLRAEENVPENTITLRQESGL